MARIPGTGPKPPTLRSRLPKLDLRPLPAIVVLTPIALLAPTDWLRAIAIVGVLAAAWAVGYFEGRAALARELLRDVRRDIPTA